MVSVVIILGDKRFGIIVVGDAWIEMVSDEVCDFRWFSVLRIIIYNIDLFFFAIPS